MLATRVSRLLYANVLKRQRELKKLTGIEPSVSAILRATIEKEFGKPVTRRRVAA